MSKKTAMDCVKLARDPKRPHLFDFIRHLCSDFEELHGDRLVNDDRALIETLCRVLADQEGIQAVRNHLLQTPMDNQEALAQFATAVNGASTIV